jgi:hypothetical protein
VLPGTGLVHDVTSFRFYGGGGTLHAALKFIICITIAGLLDGLG